MKSRFALVVALLVIGGCKPRVQSEYLGDLSALIQRSDQIIVTEQIGLHPERDWKALAMNHVERTAHGAHPLQGTP